MIEIHVIGTSYRFAPVSVRERVAVGDSELAVTLQSLRRDLAEECVILSTCNRTEIYVVARRTDFHTDELFAWLAELKGISIESEHFFCLSGAAAAKHLMEVASGVDSQAIGDVQVLGQVKQAHQASRDAGTLGKVLSRLFTAALHTGKRVKSETGLFLGAASVSFAAVELARKVFHPIANRRALVIGAGSTGKLTAASLYGQGVRDITIVNRTDARALALVARLGHGTQMPFDDLNDRLHEFDIVIVSTGAQEYLITRDMVDSAMSKRSNMQLIVDISVPRNVDPRVASVNGVFCKDLNDLNDVIETNVALRRAELPRADAIIGEELASFVAWCRTLPVIPVVARLRQCADDIVRSELERNRHRFDDDDYANIEKLVASVVRRIIAVPMGHLLDRKSAIEQTMRTAEIVSMLFNLDVETTDSAPSVDRVNVAA